MQKLSRKKIHVLFRDAEQSAQAVRLRHVNDCEEGIRRVRKNKNFAYYKGTKKITDTFTLERIRKLVIPPAWQNVWICCHAEGHLQVTGIDVRGRKQYRYHPVWNQTRNSTKFYRLYDFGKALPRIRQVIEKDLGLQGLPLRKVLAAVVSLMEKTSIRVGSSLYEKLYGSFGLTTLKDQHVKIQGDQMQFIFKGKKGVSHSISLRSKRLARIVKQCRDIPGKELFQFIDESGQRHAIDSGMVNSYIREVAGDEFTAKDFRTWAGSVQALSAFGSQEYADNKVLLKKRIVAALDQVALHLGNTRTVCRKYYVHPLIIEHYENKRLHLFYKGGQKSPGTGAELSHDEKSLMKILENEPLKLSA